MDRKTRELMIPHVERLLQRSPTQTSLFELLSLSSPDLQRDDLYTESSREKAFRSLKACLHPDKHVPAYRHRVTPLFQSVQTFYAKACQDHLQQQQYHHHKHAHAHAHTASSNSSAFQRPSKRRERTYTTSKRTSSPDSVIQLEFDVYSKWPCLHHVLRETPYQAVTASELYYHLAYQCLNYRGAIVHGQPIECTYQVPVNIATRSMPMQQQDIQSVEDVWAEAGFSPAACRILQTVDDIKDELTNRGPVMSTRFQLEPSFFHSTRHAGNFSETQLGQCHPLLIVGWTMTCHGEVWLVQGLRGPTFPIGMGQFDLEKRCLAPPTALLECKSWQSPGPFWDVPYISDKCEAWKGYFVNNTTGNNTSSTMGISPTHNPQLGTLELAPITSDELEALADLFHGGLFHGVIQERRPFVLRDAEKLAQSRRVVLRDVARVLLRQGQQKTWKVTLQVLRK